jgi:hypothetical protein
MSGIKALLGQHYESGAAIHAFFGFEGEWRVRPIDDATNYFWSNDDHGVHYADSEEELKSGEGHCYSSEILRPALLGDGYTAFIVDTHCDGNQYFMVFDNSKRREHSDEY